MIKNEYVGQIIGGGFSNLLIRQNSKHKIRIGQIFAVDEKESTTLIQIYDLQYGSQISSQNRELISGFNLEDDFSYEVYDSNIRNYVIAIARSILTINKNSNKRTELTKHLPKLLSYIRNVTNEDLNFLIKPENPLQIGLLNAQGTNIPVFLKGNDVLSHHVLVAATTGRGKSNLTKYILWNIAKQNYAGVLVLDPHNEYYGNSKQGLKDFYKKDKIIYYSTKNVPVGQRSLTIDINNIKPQHFNGVFNWSEAQIEAIYSYYKRYKKEWIKSIILDKKIENFNETTIGVIKRRLLFILDLKVENNEIISNSIFEFNKGSNTLSDIEKELENRKIVIINTSSFSGSQEILIGSLIVTNIFKKYKYYKISDNIKDKPVISIILEEAPRVLSSKILESGPNIFSTIAREGRKFKIGLYAITQIPSVIPKEILANMNTKIILGIEMKSERNAIIESAAQDISMMDRAIASLDKGEAIITSNFTRFAIPIKIPLFEDYINKDIKTYREKNNEEIKNHHNYSFSGVEIY